MIARRRELLMVDGLRSLTMHLQNLREGRSAYWNIEHWRDQSRSFADVAFFDGVSVTLTSADRAEQISAARVSPNLFALLGVLPLHGRAFFLGAHPPMQ